MELGSCSRMDCLAAELFLNSCFSDTVILLHADVETAILAKYTSCWAVIVQELCESRGGRPGLSVLTSLLVSVDVKIY